MTTSAQRVDRHLADAARHHRHVRGWSVVLLGLAVVVIVLLSLRGLWPPSEGQLQQRAASGTPAG